MYQSTNPYNVPEYSSSSDDEDAELTTSNDKKRPRGTNKKKITPIPNPVHFFQCRIDQIHQLLQILKAQLEYPKIEDTLVYEAHKILLRMCQYCAAYMTNGYNPQNPDPFMGYYDAMGNAALWMALGLQQAKATSSEGFTVGDPAACFEWSLQSIHHQLYTIARGTKFYVPVNQSQDEDSTSSTMATLKRCVRVDELGCGDKLQKKVLAFAHVYKIAFNERLDERVLMMEGPAVVRPIASCMGSRDHGAFALAVAKWTSRMKAVPSVTASPSFSVCSNASSVLTQGETLVARLLACGAAEGRPQPSPSATSAVSSGSWSPAQSPKRALTAQEKRELQEARAERKRQREEENVLRKIDAEDKKDRRIRARFEETEKRQAEAEKRKVEKRRQKDAALEAKAAEKQRKNAADREAREEREIARQIIEEINREEREKRQAEQKAAREEAAEAARVRAVEAQSRAAAQAEQLKAEKAARDANKVARTLAEEQKRLNAALEKQQLMFSQRCLNAMMRGRIECINKPVGTDSTTGKVKTILAVTHDPQHPNYMLRPCSSIKWRIDGYSQPVYHWVKNDQTHGTARLERKWMRPPEFTATAILSEIVESVWKTLAA